MSSDKNPQNDSTPVILSQLKDIASAVMYAAEANNLEQVLERIAQVSKDLVNARYAALGVPDSSGRLKYFKFVGITPEQVARMDHLPVGHGLLGAIIHERQVIRLERMQDDERSGGFCARHPHMTSLLGVPIQVGQQLFGIMYLCDREDGQPFSEQDEWLVETMAGYAALAIAGSQLGEQQRRLALLEERERISMELHDGIIQSLYAIGMHLDLMRLSNEVNPVGVEQVIGDLNLVIGDIRRYIMNLQTGDPRQRTIYQRLRDLIARLRVPETLRVQINAPDDQPLFTPATFEAICQMANEAVSNAVRHADAENITVSTRQKDNQFEIVIADDGKGFDLDSLSNHNGLGLRNLQQRAALHGGRVDIDTAPGAGTRVKISIPVRML
ncbi:MAG: GAF domain-containing sensor histidine kinase [Chloroflexi bacterium]|nr:GAF domain-containing sensor histidine kinase [Chloroflexota bacterium]